MKDRIYLQVGPGGVRGTRKTPGNLRFDEIQFAIDIQVPNELFARPVIQANINVQDVPNTVYDYDLILDTKDLIEQQTGAKIEFSIVKKEGEDNDV